MLPLTEEKQWYVLDNTPYESDETGCTTHEHRFWPNMWEGTKYTLSGKGGCSTTPYFS